MPHFEPPLVPLLVLAMLGIGIAAVLSTAESAVISVGRTEAAALAARRTPRAVRAQELISQSRRTAAAAAFGRIVAEMIATTAITLALSTVFSKWWQLLGSAAAVSTVVAVLLVRLSPRTLGRRYPVPVLVALSGTLTLVTRLGGWTANAQHGLTHLDEVSEAELREMVDRVNESQVIEAEERELIRSVFELGATLTREVMVPRTDMVTIAHDVELTKVLRLFLRSGFSRVPVVNSSPDEVLGIAYFKDVVATLQTESGPEKTVADVMRPAHFVPESKPADDLLRDLQNTRSHMALVVDEYGGIAGLVTMEDAIEEIVGEVTDEHDAAAAQITEVAPGEFRVPARTSLWNLSDVIGFTLEDDDVDTVAGLLGKALGRVPLLGASAEISGVHLFAERVDGRRKRVSTILVRRVPEPVETEEENE